MKPPRHVADPCDSGPAGIPSGESFGDNVPQGKPSGTMCFAIAGAGVSGDSSHGGTLSGIT